MTLSKRLFDVALAIFLTVLLAPLLCLLTLMILMKDGRPALYCAERMKSPTQGFRLWKFRTMHPDPKDTGVSGGNKASRITALGGLLRRYRLDELPQLWNILRGDLSFVGPRPPLRQYVDRCPELYTKVLKARPGVTGLATLVYHRHEESILENAQSADETDRLYVRRCIPIKARLDLIYQKRQNLCFDLWIIGETLRRVFGSR